MAGIEQVILSPCIMEDSSVSKYFKSLLIIAENFFLLWWGQTATHARNDSPSEYCCRACWISPESAESHPSVRKVSLQRATAGQALSEECSFSDFTFLYNLQKVIKFVVMEHLSYRPASRHSNAVKKGCLSRSKRLRRKFWKIYTDWLREFC